MTEFIIETKTLPEPLMQLIRCEKVKVREAGEEFRLIPIREPIDYIAELRGSLSDYPDMSVGKFLERKHADKELDL